MSPLPAGECVCGKSSMNQSKMGPIPRQTDKQNQNSKQKEYYNMLLFCFFPWFPPCYENLIGKLQGIKSIKDNKKWKD